MPDHEAVARELIDSVQYMTLATADEARAPVGVAVWFAHEGYGRFLWVSRPDARHSRNIGARPDVAIVIFDSTVPLGSGQAVYVEATAESLAGDEEERAIGVFSERSVAHGGAAWTAEDIRSPAPLRLYLATASAQFVLGANDERVAVSLG